ncbi:Delta-9 fatty acid desaturase protein [Mycena chlorophos]|uniref:Delta-9 fatty acid desaturase protein n=1 Tax=Mycena chlorophos TaxID=658473 RepID=A0A8H6W3K7_MYCCL|nr:Delta-9 fatty acid desaturase protein [Mycena chlorophos]
MHRAVQSFFAFRIWVLGLTTGSVAFKIIPVWLWTSEFVYLMASAAATGLAFEAPSLPGFLVTDGWLVFTAWILNLVNDTTITASLVVLLVLNRSRGVQKTTALVDKLITWTIETGLVTSLFSVLNLIFYVRQRSSFIWLGIQFVKARLFANSLLASLNSRTTLRDLDHTVADDTGTSFDLDSGGGSGAMTGFNWKSASTTASTSRPSGTLMRVSLAASPELLEGWEGQDYVLGSEQAPTRQPESRRMPV